MIKKIVAISDTHTYHDKIKLPDGDMLICSGDFTSRGSVRDISAFNHWLGQQPHRHKIIIAGNHDWLFQREPITARAIITNAIYLEDYAVEIEGLKIYGSPWQPEFCNWAFNLPRDGYLLKDRWDLIPENLDVLITHGPPLGIMDTVNIDRWNPSRGVEHVGCKLLRDRVALIKPRVHIFGHLHDGYGTFENEHTRFYNASTCDESYSPINPPHVIEM